MDYLSPKTPEKYDSEYIFIQDLGSSKFDVKVYLQQNIHKSIFVVLKLFTNTYIQNPLVYFQREKSAYQCIKHQNVMKLLDIVQFECICQDSMQKQIVNGLLLEYAAKGSLLNYVEKTGPFTEKMARTLIKQLLKGVQAIHDSGYAHLDLKLENLLFSDDFTLKIADFDLARPCSEFFRGRIGSPHYYAPEILENKYFKGIPADIFSIGVIIFVMITQTFPFEEEVAIPYGKLYTCFQKKSFKSFWNFWENEGYVFSLELQTLLNSIWSYDISKRPTIKEILNSEWMKLEEESVDNYKKIMQEKYYEFTNMVSI